MAVTTPLTLLTRSSLSGERCEEPWICWIVTVDGSCGACGVQAVAPAADDVGVGVPTVKSTALSSVSVHSLLRKTDVEFVVAGAGEPSATLAPPQPTRSTVAPFGSMMATRPAVPDIAIVPVTSGFSRAGADAFAPSASLTRKWCPGATWPLSGVFWALVPDADQYWTLQPVRSTGALEVL